MDMLKNYKFPDNDEIGERSSRALEHTIARIPQIRKQAQATERLAWSSAAAFLIVAAFISVVAIIHKPAYADPLLAQYTQENPNADESALWLFAMENDYLIAQYYENPSEDNLKALKAGVWDYVTSPSYFELSGTDLNSYMKGVAAKRQSQFLNKVYQYEQSKIVSMFVQ